MSILHWYFTSPCRLATLWVLRRHEWRRWSCCTAWVWIFIWNFVSESPERVRILQGPGFHKCSTPDFTPRLHGQLALFYCWHEVKFTGRVWPTLNLFFWGFAAPVRWQTRGIGAPTNEAIQVYQESLGPQVSANKNFSKSQWWLYDGQNLETP